MRLLIIEDEDKIVRFLTRALKAHGYELISADNGEDGARLALSEPFDLVMLDIMMPGIDGHQTLELIRESKPDLPVLMLTARDDVENRVRAFDAGADQYLTKPFALEELLARIRTLTRRKDAERTPILLAGDLVIDTQRRKVRRGDEVIELSNREFALLEYFLRHPGEVLSRRRLLKDIWEYAFDPGTNVVDVYVRYLRHKIDRPGMPSTITTVRGDGYRFDIPVLVDTPSQ
jgi:two-component system OmpR family response regulator